MNKTFIDFIRNYMKKIRTHRSYRRVNSHENILLTFQHSNIPQYTSMHTHTHTQSYTLCTLHTGSIDDHRPEVEPWMRLESDSDKARR